MATSSAELNSTFTCWPKESTIGATKSSAPTSANVDGVRAFSSPFGPPTRQEYSVIGDFNEWRPGVHNPLGPRRGGRLGRLCPGIAHQERSTNITRFPVQRVFRRQGRPVRICRRDRPNTASKVWDLGGYDWGDAAMDCATAAGMQASMRPISIYEVHLGSWARVPDEGNRWLTYREIGVETGRLRS